MALPSGSTDPMEEHTEDIEEYIPKVTKNDGNEPIEWKDAFEPLPLRAGLSTRRWLF